MEQKWNLQIHDLWKNGTNSVHNMHLLNTDSKSYLTKTPEGCRQDAAKEKKSIYLWGCLQQRWHFSPLFDSIDGLMGVEAKAILNRMASRLATKWHQPYLRTCGYIKSMNTINLMQARHRCIWGSRVIAHRISVQCSRWEDSVVLNLFR